MGIGRPPACCCCTTRIGRIPFPNAPAAVLHERSSLAEFPRKRLWARPGRLFITLRLEEMLDPKLPIGYDVAHMQPNPSDSGIGRRTALFSSSPLLLLLTSPHGPHLTSSPLSSSPPFPLLDSLFSPSPHNTLATRPTIHTVSGDRSTYLPT